MKKQEYEPDKNNRTMILYIFKKDGNFHLKKNRQLKKLKKINDRKIRLVVETTGADVTPEISILLN